MTTPAGKTVAVVQARMGSTRLPGKTLMQAAGKPLLAHLIERLQRARLVEQIVVATTVNPEDDAIEDLCGVLSVECFRGSSEDVLGRVVGALQAFEASTHVEIHADGPLLDWQVVDELICRFHENSCDLATNAGTITYPPGLEAWVYSTRLIERVEGIARDPEYRESPSLYLMQNRDRYSILNLEAPPELRRPGVYLEVDEAVDFEVLREVIEALYPVNPAFTTADILAYLDAHPDLADRNRAVERRWKAFQR